jgi:capsular exopolysaccharide synthesis family protein
MSPLESTSSLGDPETPAGTADFDPGQPRVTDPVIHLVDPAEAAAAGGGAWSEDHAPALDHAAVFPNGRGRTFFQVLRRHWRIACCRGLLAALAMTAATYWALPPRYNAHALVQLLPQNSPTMSSGGPQEDFATYRATQIARFRSHAVLQAALAGPGIAELGEVRRFADPLAWLEKTLALDDGRDSAVLTASLVGRNPDDLAAVLNAVAETYIHETVQQRTALRLDHIEHLQQNYQKCQEVVRDKQNQLREREEKLAAPPSSSGPLDRPLLEKRLTRAKREWHQIQGQLEDARRELAAAGDKPLTATQAAVAEAAVDEFLKQDPAARQHRARLAELDEQIARIEELATPAVRAQLLERPRQEREEERAALAARREAARRALVSRIPGRKPAEHAADLDHLRQQIAALTEQERTLSRQARDLEESSRRSPDGPRSPEDSPQDIVVLKSELDGARTALRTVGERLELLRSDPLAPEASLLQPAVPPRVPDRGQPLVLACLAGCGSFILVVYALGWREFRSQKVYALDDLRGLGLNVIGAVPLLPLRTLRSALSSDLASGMEGRPGSEPTEPPAPGGERQLYWHNLLVESVDTLRTQLVRVADTTGLRVLMVTSAVSGEGKTSLACHLATSLARAWRKTLLIDGDLRHPQVHQHFDLPLDLGFSEVLRGETDVNDAIRSTPLPRLWVLPAGQRDGYAVQALAQAEMGQLFDSLKEQYDFIVVDSSSVLRAADTLSLGQHVDGVLLSVLADQSRLPAVRGAYHRLATLGIRVLGTVVHGAPRGGW